MKSYLWYQLDVYDGLVYHMLPVSLDCQRLLHTEYLYILWFNLDNIYSAWIQNRLYMYCRWRSRYQEGRIGISLTSLTPPHSCACPKPGPGFPKSYVVVFSCVQRVQLRLEVIVRFVDIGGMLKFSFPRFIIWTNS